VRRSWTSKPSSVPSCKVALSTSVVTGKVDVYAEPIFGLRLM